MDTHNHTPNGMTGKNNRQKGHSPPRCHYEANLFCRDNLVRENKKVIKKSSEIKGIKKYNKSGDLIYNIDNIKEECKKKMELI